MNNAIKKWLKVLSTHFSKDTYKWPIIIWKGVQLFTKETQVKTKMRYYDTPISMATIKKIKEKEQ